MLRIRVVQINGAPTPTTLAQEFDERGGSIGRSESNRLILPDPDRHISRMQAEVQHRAGAYLLVDHGGNPTLLNGRPLGKGVSAPLGDGDEIGIAEYTLRVEVIRKAPLFANGMPASQPRGGDPLGLLEDRPPPAPPAAFVPPASPAIKRSDDDPFAVFAPTTPPPASQPVATPAENPFAAFAPSPPARPAAPTPGRALDICGLAQASDANSLNALFGLDPVGNLHDPFANSSLGDPAGAPSALSGGSADPLALFGGASAQRSTDPVRHDSSLLHDAFTPPQLVKDTPPVPPPPVAPPPPQQVAARPLSAPQGGVISWANTAPDEAPIAPAPLEAPAIETTRSITDAPAPTPGLSVNVDPPGRPSASPPLVATAESAALLAAFARGIGLPGLNPPNGITPELMEHVGLMLRAAVQGTIELLIARAATKREVRSSNITMILSKNNNPLKFSPDVDFALMQLLLPQGSGFMQPDAAMRDAYDDLRAHQVGFAAGMRAALNSVLGRFTPAQIEAQLSTRSLLDNVLPANRKAKLWDLFEQRYSDISREAEDDFHSIFGREFNKAYEAQIEQLGRSHN
ncbi:MAG: type VI secretion system-associated FHA domain protein TagH [Azonexus sp.]